MHILHIIPSLGVGGTEKILYELCRGLEGSRFSNTVVSLKSEGPTAQALRLYGVNVRTLGSPDPFIRGVLDLPRLYIRLKDLIHQLSPDIVHTWLTRANVIGRLAAKGFPCKVISSLRVMEREKSYHLKAEKLTQKYADIITVNSTELESFAIKHIGIPPERIKLIYNGVDLPVNQHRDNFRNKKDKGDILFGAMGRLHSQKGFDIFLKSAKLVLDKNPNCWFLIAGEGPELKSLMALCEKLGISSRVKFPGRMDANDFYAHCDVFVLSSRWEGMPNVVMEAMACGLPVAASQVGGVSDLIVHGQEGLIFEPENPQACAQVLLRYASEFILRKQVALQAQKKIKEKFTMPLMLSEYIKLYEDVFSGN